MTFRFSTKKKISPNDSCICVHALHRQEVMSKYIQILKSYKRMTMLQLF
jgi:hypothetical protein